MRRLCVALVGVALLLASLAGPALAGRPTYVIRSVTVTSLGLDSGGCDVQVKVWFREERGATGDAIKIQQFYGTSVAATHTVDVSEATKYRGGLLATNTFYGLTLWSGTWHWGAYIEDSPPAPLTSTALTNNFVGSGTTGTCPDVGLPLAAYPIP